MLMKAIFNLIDPGDKSGVAVGGVSVVKSPCTGICRDFPVWAEFTPLSIHGLNLILSALYSLG